MSQEQSIAIERAWEQARQAQAAKRAAQRALSLAEKRQVKISDLDLSVRPYNCLRRAGVTTLGELLDLCPRELMEWQGMGKRSVREIQDVIADDYDCALRVEVNTRRLRALQRQYTALSLEEQQGFQRWLSGG
jgi:DNA-directed RNA polymerase alpha subunit